MSCIHLYTVLNQIGSIEVKYFEKIHFRKENQEVFKELDIVLPDIENIIPDNTLNTNIFL